MLIREPTSADVPALGRLHAEAWQSAYVGQLPAEVLCRATVERRTALWMRILADGVGPRERIHVAEAGRGVVGFAHTGPCRDQDAVDGLGELYAINVAPAWWGKGAGPALLAAAHRSLAAADLGNAVLWVLPRNVRARRFYEGNGWAADGVARDVQLGSVPIAEVRYAIDLRPLADPAAEFES
jgi:ribosomal protein S18 acetylase RimI-like enzyme